MYRSVGMGNWLTDLVGGRLQLPPVTISLPGGVAIMPTSAVSSASPPAPVVQSGMTPNFATWLIPAGVVISAAIFLLGRRR